MAPQDFFNFYSKLGSSTIQVHSVGLKDDENGKNSHLKLIKANFQGIEFPVVFRQEYGTRLDDILDTGFPGLYLISNRMKIVLEENKLTGWKIFPIKLYDKKGIEIVGYNGFSVAGQSSPTKYDKSEIIEVRKVPNGPVCKYYKGVFVDGWDGSDFFTPEGTYQIFISNKAAAVLKKNKITNMYIENLAESQIPVRYVKKDSNGNIENFTN